MKPQSFVLQVANYYLLAAGLFILGLILIPISARWGWPLNSAPSLIWMLALFVGARGYKKSKERRLQQYADEIERRMRTPSN
jgi:hypothetical protein